MPHTIHQPTPCWKCGYSLVGLSVDGACPECGERAAKSHPQCPRCATRGQSVALMPVEESSFKAWACGQCLGMGFDPGQLKRAIEQRRWSGGTPSVAILHRRDLTQGTPCGRCGEAMEPIALRCGSIVDRCKSCKWIWLDRGELAALVEHIRHHLGDDPTPRHIEESIADPEVARRRSAKSSSPFGEATKFDGGYTTVDLLFDVLAALIP